MCSVSLDKGVATPAILPRHPVGLESELFEPHLMRGMRLVDGDWRVAFP